MAYLRKRRRMKVVEVVRQVDENNSPAPHRCPFIRFIKQLVARLKKSKWLQQY